MSGNKPKKIIVYQVSGRAEVMVPENKSPEGQLDIALAKARNGDLEFETPDKNFLAVWEAKPLKSGIAPGEFKNSKEQVKKQSKE